MISAQIRERLRWANQNLASVGAIAVLAIFCTVNHQLAEAKMEFYNRRFLVMDGRAIAEIKLIDFVNVHYVLAALYFVACILVLVWLKIHRTPTGYRRLAFVIAAFPGLAYAWTCAQIFFKFAF